MGLAVVYDRLFISVEGQCTQLVGDLFRQTERIGERAEVEFDGEDKVGVDDTWAGLYKSDDNTERRRGNKTEGERKTLALNSPQTVSFPHACKSCCLGPQEDADQ